MNDRRIPVTLKIWHTLYWVLLQQSFRCPRKCPAAQVLARISDFCPLDGLGAVQQRS
jgi:hypothetical protein